jgi:Fe-S cluster assembly protein SufB
MHQDIYGLKSVFYQSFLFMSDQSLKETLETSDKIVYSVFLDTLNEETVRAISNDQNEPERMLTHRLKSLQKFKEMPMPSRGPALEKLDLNTIVWYAKPESEGNQGTVSSREEVDPVIKRKFDKLGIPEAERKYLAGAGGQMDSQNVYHNIKQKRAEKGVIFEDMALALHTHSALVQKYFMKLVPIHDHKFAALHGAVRSGGTFIYIPKGVHVDEPLQAYFRMNTYG